MGLKFVIVVWLSKFCVYSSRRPVGSEVFDCGEAFSVLCLFLTAPCVGMTYVTVVRISKFCVYSSRRPVWL